MKHQLREKLACNEELWLFCSLETFLGLEGGAL